MKKVLFLIFVTTFSSAIYSQSTVEGFSKGSLFAGGQVSFSSEKFDENEARGFSFNPRIGYFLSNNLAVGVNVGFATSKEEQGVVIKSDFSSTSFGVFGRYYFTPANKFSVFGNLGANYSTTTNKTLNPDLKINGFGVSLSPGINYFISKKIAIETSIGLLSYSTSKPDIDGAESTNSFDFNLGLDNLSFGLIFKFN